MYFHRLTAGPEASCGGGAAPRQAPHVTLARALQFLTFQTSKMVSIILEPGIVIAPEEEKVLAGRGLPTGEADQSCPHVKINKTPIFVIEQFIFQV